MDNPLIRIIIEFAKAHPGIILRKTFLSIGKYPLEVVGISLISGKMFRTLSKEGNKNTLIRSVYKFILIISLIYLAIEIIMFIYDKMDIKFWPDVNEYLRKELLNMVWNKSRENDSSNITSEVVAHLLKIPDMGDVFFDYVQKYMIPFILVMTTIIIYFSFVDLPLGLVSACLIFLYIFSMIQHGRNILLPRFYQEQKEFDLFKYIDDILQNTGVIFSTNSQSDERIRIHERENELRSVFHRYYHIKTNHNFLFSTLNLPITISMVGFALFRFSKGAFPIDKLITLMMIFMFYFNYIHTGVRRITEMILVAGPMLYLDGFLTSFTNNLQRSHEINLSNRDIGIPFSKKDATRDASVGSSWTLPQGEIDIHDVYFSYPNSRKQILININIHIKPGELVALTGTSGSGKSTLCRMIMGYLHPTNGFISFDGIKSTDISLEDMRFHITYMSQDRKLFHRSFYENMTYGIPNASEPSQKQKYITAIQDFFRDIDGFSILPMCDPSDVSYSPQNWDRSVGNSGSGVSGGQAQLILLARAFLHQRKIIVLDEPTTGIDIHHIPLFIKGIDKLCQGKTTVIITHDPRVINLCSRVISMHHGKVVHDEVHKRHNT